MTTGSAHYLRWTFVAPIPSASSDSFSMSRRTLYRALAVVVALAAMAPLVLAVEAKDGVRGGPPRPLSRR